MKILLMCEGKNEEVLLNILLAQKAFKFTPDDLIGRRPYALRQLNNPTIISELKHYGEPVTIYRIGDKQNEKFNIPKELKTIINKDSIFKYCTKPELEILLIINEGLIKEYEKVKQNQSPKDFAKSNIKFNGKRYNQSSSFLMEYYENRKTNDLVANIIYYKSYKKHTKKDELYLSDLLK